MDVISTYPDKENLQLGRPVVKVSDVNKVKRNLSVMPLKTKNQMNNNTINQANTHTCVRSGREFVNSPVSELANTFTELAAHESTYTPKRRLSLTSSSGSPTPELVRLGSLNTVRSSRLASPSTTDSDSKTEFLQPKKTLESRFKPRSLNDTRKHRLSNGSAFRRLNSMPNEYFRNEGSPLLNVPIPKCNLVSPLAASPPKILSPPKAVFFYSGEESGDSGLGKDEEFHFVAPNVPPEHAQAANEQSPVRMVPSSQVIGSPDIHESNSWGFVDSPLLAHRLCSRDDEEVDDGFVDLDDLERQNSAENDVPDAIANMLTGKLLTSPCQSSDFKSNLFKSPSVPTKLDVKSKSFDIRKRVLCSKRPDPPRDSNTPVAANKKRRAVVSDGNLLPLPSPCRKLESPDNTSSHKEARLQRCKSMVEHSATYELNRTDCDPDLTGDFSRKCCLPLINGKHRDLKCIAPETMAKIVRKEYDDRIHRCTVIDCRFPYEYEGGHIQGAENIYTKEEIYNRYLSQVYMKPERDDDKRSILIFHCEFSSERAPKLSRFLRNHDRMKNKDTYPNLYYPEIYLLEGGYKAFYENHKDLCVPQSYKPMLHKDHVDDMKNFRIKSKSWAGDEKRSFRPGLSRKL